MKIWEELTISDDFIFQLVMKNESICKNFLGKLFGFKIENLTYAPFTTLVQKISAQGEDGKIYDVIAKIPRDIDDAVKLAQYYESVIFASADVVNIHTLEGVNDSRVILICRKDPFGENLQRYSLEYRCNENPELKFDFAQEIFLYTKGAKDNVDADIKNFLNYLEGKPAVGDFVKQIDDEVNLIKKVKHLEFSYIVYLQEITQAKREREIEITKNLLSEKASLDLVAKVTGWTKEKILELAKAEGIATEKI